MNVFHAYLHGKNLKFKGKKKIYVYINLARKQYTQVWSPGVHRSYTLLGHVSYYFKITKFTFVELVVTESVFWLSLPLSTLAVRMKTGFTTTKLQPHLVARGSNLIFSLFQNSYREKGSKYIPMKLKYLQAQG